jgi:hypothetical protein
MIATKLFSDCSFSKYRMRQNNHAGLCLKAKYCFIQYDENELSGEIYLTLNFIFVGVHIIVSGRLSAGTFA